MNEKVHRERLMQVLHYCDETGVFSWRESRGRVKAGSIAGTVCTNRGASSYLSISIDGNNYRAHHLVWLLKHGNLPFGQLDHIDCDKLNNRISNLREVSTSENQQNQQKAHVNNSSGLIGATLHKNRFWRAQITLNGKAKHLGYFPTAEEAHKAYVVAKREIHPFGTL